MNIEWPAAVIILMIIISITAIISEVIKGRARATQEAADAIYGEQYRRLSADYATLAKETRDSLVELRQKVETIERMLKDVA